MKKVREILVIGINVSFEEIIFISGVIELNNLVIKGIVEVYFNKGKYIIMIIIEYNVVFDFCVYL